MTDRDTLIATLATLSNHDEAGRHFTEVCSTWDEMEAKGLIEIQRPVHETGIPYSEDYWTFELTEDGEAEVYDWREHNH